MSNEKREHDLSIDAEKLRARYEAERNKRINTAGTDQYIFTEGKFAEFADDPYADEPAPRSALQEDLDFLVIGAGFGGLQLGAALRHGDIDNFRILDVAADFGGTWYWNRYPGLRCDVESYIYLPFLEETGYVPTERYVRGNEIFAYCQLLGRHFNLYDRALFQTKVTGMKWDENAARWIVTTTRGDTFRARFVTTQSGIFSRPQLPGIRGIEEFEGHAFHSARWDYEYTGGSTEGELGKLSDKRIGIIGTGTTALQVVPEVARYAKEVTIFQRTPTAVGVRGNAPTDIEWFKSQPPGWQDQRIDAFNRLANGEEVVTDIDDGWVRFFRKMINSVKLLPANSSPSQMDEAQEIADFEYNESIRSRVNEIVKSPEKADLLKAYYRTMCKRPGFSDDYLPAFNQEHVHVVDVSGGIDRIKKKTVVVNGIDHEVDCLIFCTGFELGTTWTHQAGYEVVGKDGKNLSEKWQNGLLTYHGLFSRGFPNMFFMGLTQTGVTINVPHMLKEQINHLVFIVKYCIENNIRTVETTQEAEDKWQKEMAIVSEARRPFQESCTPGYYNAEGRVDDQRSAIGTGWYLPSTSFFDMWKKWRNDGDFKGLELNR